jgi:WS/DGAT/MGAT family acyltransferase
MGAFFDPTPDAPAPPVAPWTPAPRPTGPELLADNLRRRGAGLAAGLAGLARPRTTVRQARRGWPALRELLAGEPGRKTSLHRLIGPDRTLAVVHGTLAEVRAIADRHDATVNDVLLTLTAGGLRALLSSRGEPVDGTLPIYVPVSLRRGRGGPAEGNLISQMVVPLPVGIVDPGRRLRRIAAETVERKALARTSLGTLFRGRIASALMMIAIKRQRVNVVSADIPGPEQPLYLAATQVLAVFPVLNLIGTVTLAVGAVSYAGTFTIAVTADRDAYPDVEVLAAGIADELMTLGAMEVAHS